MSISQIKMDGWADGWAVDCTVYKYIWIMFVRLVCECKIIESSKAHNLTPWKISHWFDTSRKNVDSSFDVNLKLSKFKCNFACLTWRQIVIPLMTSIQMPIQRCWYLKKNHSMPVYPKRGRLSPWAPDFHRLERRVLWADLVYSVHGMH